MSGHNKWAKIKRKKGANDVKRGRIFTRLIKEMAIAARDGGGNVIGNPRLRLAVDRAQAVNMPLENIKRAIQRGTGELPGISYEEVTYEAFGPAGVAIMIECVTDNRNRSVAELRNLLDKNNAKMGAVNSVAYMFHRHGVISVAAQGRNEDELMIIILEAGADDMKLDDGTFHITTSTDAFEGVRQALEAKNIAMEEAEIQLLPENTIHVEGREAEQVLKLIEALEDNEDVQNVYANFDIDEKDLSAYAAE